MIERLGQNNSVSVIEASPIHSQVAERGKTKPVQVEEKDWHEGVFPRKQVENTVKKMNDFMAASNQRLKFEFHDKLNEYYVTIIDRDTNEVIREVPPKKILDMYAEMTEYIGLMVDRKI